MMLMSINDEKKEFTKVSTEGYNAEEVDAYIAKLRAELTRVKQEHKYAQANMSKEFWKEYESMKAELASYHEIETKLKEALRAAHKATENIQQIVENESRRILYEANKNADEIISEALDQSMSSLKYIKKMRTDARVFQKRFEVFVAAQNDFIDETIWDEILAPIDPYEFMNIRSIDDIKKMEKDDNEKHDVEENE